MPPNNRIPPYNNLNTIHWDYIPIHWEIGNKTNTVKHLQIPERQMKHIEFKVGDKVRVCVYNKLDGKIGIIDEFTNGDKDKILVRFDDYEEWDKKLRGDYLHDGDYNNGVNKYRWFIPDELILVEEEIKFNCNICANKDIKCDVCKDMSEGVF